MTARVVLIGCERIVQTLSFHHGEARATGQRKPLIQTVREKRRRRGEDGGFGPAHPPAARVACHPLEGRW